ncbi:putative UDP-glycosyltransferase 74F2-like [Capsicum annuum]|nr:putative UDP-glycosyltransferase 74F2-like [Capsicum annuum]
MLSLSKPSTGELGERPCKAASLSVKSMSASQLLSGVHITSKAEEFLAYTFPSKASSWEKGVKKSSDQLEHAPSKKTGVESVLKHHSDIKKSESKFQDQDSTSTLSTGQSNHMEAAMGKSESATNTLPWPQVHHDHPTACLSYPWDDTYFGRLIATYGSNAIIYPQIVGVTSTRVALPLECTESLPIYVNPKQCSAILKRRQAGGKISSYMVQHSESGSWETSNQSGSNATSIFNGNDMFQQPEFRVSGFPFHMGATMQEAEDFIHVGT